MRRVLVVDDEAAIRSLLRGYLESDGFTVTEASEAKSALASVVAEPPDVVLLDVMLPGVDGLEVLRQIRNFSDVYVILITARAEEVDKLVGLGVGADDYITKPFSPREVVARVRTILRRDRGAQPDQRTALVFDRLIIDVDGHTVSANHQPVNVSSLEFDLLVALANAPQRVFSRAQLLERVWGSDFYGDERVVDVHIRSLRARLGDDANDPHLIATVRGVGYKFIGTRA